MKVFDGAGPFSLGRWASGVKRDLMPMRLIPGPPAWNAKCRIRRGTGRQWVQYEPDGWSGPFFWSGKPACIGLDHVLLVGYFVERGVASHSEPSRVMDSQWHWKGFERCLAEPQLRNELNALVLDLPETRRTLWLEGSGLDDAVGRPVPRFEHALPYVGMATLDEAMSIVDASHPDQWINAMVACRFPKDECLTRQGEVVKEFRNPIIRANEIKSLVVEAMPPGPNP